MDRLAAALTLPVLPLWAVVTALHPRWSRDWRGRWGWEVPPVQPGAIWVHGSSVGEVGAAWALACELPDPVLLTVDTDTGAARARQLARARPGVAVGIKPVDHLWTLAPLWAEARPRAVVFVEGTFWPALAWRARREGVPVLRVSAAIGPRTARFGPLLKAWWWPVDQVWARDPAAAAALSRVHRGPVAVGGDLKRHLTPGPSPLRWSRPFAVGASTRPGDEARLLDATRGMDLQLLLAPRHLERLPELEVLLAGRRWARRTAIGGEVDPALDIVVLDTLGELHACLASAAFVFVGGTFDEAIGGHSPWEAASAGAPVVAGPHVARQGSAFAEVGAAMGQDLRDAIRRCAPPPALARSPIGSEVAACAGPPAPERSPRPWLLPVGWVVEAAARARRELMDRGPVTWMPVPVISVGSDNARSPGRTSTVLALVRHLRQGGHSVGVALRGYRRADRSRAVRVSWEDATADALGDEGALAHLAGAKVAAGPDRVAAARALVGAGCTVVVLDDGLQRRDLGRDLDLVIVDARFPQARGPLPAGERRGRSAGDLVLVQHGSAAFPAEGIPLVRRFGPWVRDDGRPVAPPAVALAGIGRAADFFATLDVAVEDRWALPDHQRFDPPLVERLLAWAAGRAVLCTDKDAVRMPAPLRATAAWRTVEVTLPDEVVARLPRP